MSKVIYNYGYNAFACKNALRKSFFKDFYEFIKNNCEFDFSSINVNNADEFVAFCGDWNALGKSDLYGPGNTLNPFYLTSMGKSWTTVEEQPTTTFIGAMYKQGKYVEFIKFLPEFFGYWRRDEGCDCFGPVDTYDFYYRAWDSLVDTLKFFYFTSDTLESKYVWFKSLRVKDALDNIPSVYKSLKCCEEFEGTLKLAPVALEGFKFEGWFADPEYKTPITEVKENATVYAKLVK